MELSLERPLLFFDIESTGLSIATDGIIELSFVKVFPDSHKEVKTWKIRPRDYATGKQIPISPSASAVNGVKDEDLIGCPYFFNVIEEVADWLRGCDLAGFNSTKFDLPLLAEEFGRARKYCQSRIDDPKVPEDKKNMAREMLRKTDIDFHECRMVDVQNIYHFMEPRNLKAAYRFYCGGKDFENAHTAEADTMATYEVLLGQLEMYKEPDAVHDQALKNDVKSLSEVGGRPKTMDFAGRIQLRDGVPVIAFGKHKDRTVEEVFNSERSYFDWIERGDFTEDTKEQFRKLAAQYKASSKAKASEPPSDAQLQNLRELYGKRR